MVEGQAIAEAEDYNKKNAEQIASEKAMLKMGILNLEDAELTII